MKRLLLVLAFLTPVAAMAQTAPAKAPMNPAVAALGQMAQEGQLREAQALSQVYSLQSRNAELEEQLAAEKKRADDAEAKLQREK